MSLEGPDSLTPGPIASVHLDMCLDQQHRWGEGGGRGGRGPAFSPILQRKEGQPGLWGENPNCKR